MRGWVHVVVAVALAVPSAVSAQEKLSLGDAMARARAEAYGVKAAVARAGAAAEKSRQARGFRLPSVKLEASYISTNSPAEAFAFKLNQERFSFNDFVTSDPNDPSHIRTGMTRLEVQLPLFTGGELSGRIEQAGLASEAASDTRDWASDQAALDAAEAYVMVEQAREYVALLSKARDTVAAHVDLATKYAEQGMIVDSEVMRAKVELSRVEDMLAKAKGDAETASSHLAYVLAMDLGTNVEVEPLPAPEPLDGALGSWLDTADARSDLMSARKMLKAGEIEPKVQRAALLPHVALIGRGDLFDDVPFGTHGESTTVMAAASWKLWAGGSDRAAVAAARFEAEAGREDVRRFEEGVRLDVRQAFVEAQTARDRHATAARALEAAAESERITEARFKSGVVKMIDLVDADTARREAETRELVARADALAATLRLAVKAGRRPETVLPQGR